MAIVAVTVYHFTEQYSNSSIIVIGNTRARTRRSGRGL
ncbi:hypothetical protein [Parapedobacter defluvii]